MNLIHTETATHPHGHYSQAIEHQGLIYISGLLGNSRVEHIDSERSILVQVQNCLDDLEQILVAANSDLSRVLKLSIYVADVEQWPEVDALCSQRFGAHKPARAVIPALTMRYGSIIEIDGIACTNE